ncbi:MAG: carboxypeptidase-like regulatory domain-containing protein [Bacteroidota bacterium]|nr:carboxypeptidase-like regulatory domain-containing protein [Bacteroidota bacterium]
MSRVASIRKQLFLLWVGVCTALTASAQVSLIHGVVKDKQSDEPIPFASAVFKQSGRGALTDSAGHFILYAGSWTAHDTLQILTVGYKPVLIPISFFKDSATFVVKMELLPPSTGVTVKAKYNRALWFWRRIIKNKPQHDRTYWDNYSYEIYNKLEVDLENINTNKLGQNKLLKPLNFVFNYIDSTSEEKPFLPAYLTETLSDYYHEKNPSRSREIIKASRTNGIDNESLIKQLGGMYQNVNIYSNFIPVFDKQYVSPFNDRADNYYNFKLLDTQYLNKKRLVHLRFTPKHKGEDVFEGDCWVHDTTYAIQKITLRPAIDANINFVTGLSLIQEFKQVKDSIWFLYKDKFVVDISPLGQSKLSLKGRKTATYKNVVLNDSSVIKKLDEAKTAEQVDIIPNTKDLPDSFWVKNRHEELSKSEKTVYILLDTLEKNTTYIHYRNAIQFLTTGVKDLGNFRIGPWYYWMSGNPWEGQRLRFDLSTNKDFDKHWYMHGYMAYGTLDNAFKGKAEVRYEFQRDPWGYINLSYKNDLDNGQMYHDQLGTDNVFATIFRRPNIPFKYQKSEEKKLEFYQETNKGLGFGLTVSSKQYQALINLPGAELFPVSNGGDPFNSFETAFRVRFAYLERNIYENFDRTSLGSDWPIVELKFAHGWPGVLKSSYEYNKVDASVSDYLKIPPYGSIYYNLFAGKIFGTLPYQLLEIHPGNELYYYNRYAFNLMNRYEYISDRYAGFNIEHNIGNGLFRFIPLTRKWKFRQFWSARGVIGDLSDANKQMNFVGNYPFHSLNGNWYTEVGTGVDNIFKFFRVDFVWRLSPQPMPNEAVNKFGVFASFRVAF